MAFVAALFADSRARPQVLRRRSPVRWEAYPPGVIPLTAAEPDFPAPEVVTDAIAAYLTDGHYPYTPPEGLLELREVLAEVAHTRYGVDTTADRVVVTVGTAAALWAVVHLLCGPDDECILMDPVDLLSGQAVSAAGATPVRCPVDPATGRLDPDRLISLITLKNRLICLCNPHNPSGAVFPEDALRAMAQAAVERGVPILSDEVWNEIVYPPATRTSIARLPGPDTFTLLGVSKTFALPSLRVGFVIAPTAAAADRLRHTIHRLGGDYSVTPLGQVGAIAALRDGWAWRDAFVHHLRHMRDYCCRRSSSWRMPPRRRTRGSRRTPICGSWMAAWYSPPRCRSAACSTS